MRGLISVLALVTACGGENGAVVVVHTDGNAARVELFLSKAPCADCPGLTPPSRTGVTPRPVNGDGWIVFDIDRFHVDLDGGKTARFFLKNDSGQDAQFVRLLAVALEGDLAQETVVAAATVGPLVVPDGEAELHIDLVKADPLDSATENEHVELWRRPNDADSHAACAIVQHNDGSAEFFVPEDDHDCDDFMSTPARPECSDLGGVRPPRIGEARCVLPEAQSGYCVIGGPLCTDTPDANTPTCIPVEKRHCLSASICSLAGVNVTCATNPFSNECVQAASTTYVPTGCDAQTTLSGAPCDADGIGDGTLQATEVVADLGSGSCAAIEIASPRAPLEFGATAEVGEVQLATITLVAGTFNPTDCTVRMQWTGASLVSRFAIVRITTDTGVYRVVPLKFHPAPGNCDGADSVTCYSMGIPSGDSLRVCH